MKADMFDADVGLKLPGKFFGYLAGQPILPPFGLQQTPYHNEQQQNSEENPDKYFENLSQGEFLKMCKSS
jgi:hypothetical protein